MGDQSKVSKVVIWLQKNANVKKATLENFVKVIRMFLKKCQMDIFVLKYVSKILYVSALTKVDAFVPNLDGCNCCTGLLNESGFEQICYDQLDFSFIIAR